MITHCDECNTYFRVTIVQLRAANGKVKCGCCMHVFNAIESLIDDMETVQESSNLDMGRKIYQETDNKPSESNNLAGKPGSSSDAEKTEESDPGFADEALEGELTSARENFADIDPIELNLEGKLPVPRDSIYDTPVVIRSWSFTDTLWIGSTLLLLSALFYQYFHFNSAQVLADLPQLQALCRFIKCDENRATVDTSRIKLLSRDIRQHPQLSDVLLVNITIANEAEYKQPFPRLQLDLFDSYGRAVGSRRFNPDEYLDDSVNPASGMTPQQPIHVVLEIVGTDAAVSSFEFNFL